MYSAHPTFAGKLLWNTSFVNYLDEEGGNDSSSDYCGEEEDHWEDDEEVEYEEDDDEEQDGSDHASLELIWLTYWHFLTY